MLMTEVIPGQTSSASSLGWRRSVADGPSPQQHHPALAAGGSWFSPACRMQLSSLHIAGSRPPSLSAASSWLPLMTQGSPDHHPSSSWHLLPKGPGLHMKPQKMLCAVYRTRSLRLSNKGVWLFLKVLLPTQIILDDWITKGIPGHIYKQFI